MIKTIKKDILNILIVIFAVVAVTFLVPYFYSIFTTIPGKMFAGIFVYALYIAIILFVNFILEKGNASSLGFQKEKVIKQIKIGLFLAMFLISVFVLIPLLFGINKTDLLPHKAKNIGIMIYEVMHRLFFVGVGEELIFRGYLYTKFKNLTKSGVTTVIITSILFGFWHIILSGSIAQVIVTTIIGLFFGFARLKIKDCSITSVSIAHGLYDALLAVLSWCLI